MAYSYPKYDCYQRGLASMVYKFLDKKWSAGGVAPSLASKYATEPNYQLSNEVHKQIIKKFKKRKVYSFF